MDLKFKNQVELLAQNIRKVNKKASKKVKERVKERVAEKKQKRYETREIVREALRAKAPGPVDYAEKRRMEIEELI